MPHRQPPSIHFQRHGTGAPVLLIHGLGSRGSDWDFQIPALSADYQVITVDLRGHGASPLGPTPMSIPAMAAELTALLDTLALAPVHVVGFSLGGMVAQEMALQAPGRLRSLCLINSGPCALPGRLRRHIELCTRTALIRLLGMRWLGRLLARRLFPRASQRSLATRFGQQLAAMPRASYLAALQALRHWDITPRLGDIHTPTLILAADRDYTPVPLRRALAGRMPRCEFAVVGDSGHASPMDQPDTVNRLLRDFLARQQAPQQPTETITTLPAGDRHAQAH
ncbi:alpha/beta fold hydrolase [Parahaliea mediterranea]|uniref:alpha/beta fold hydrolase n=1 Tax=Parahaliea mediterranea TaxID=651086 RepID=UPI000E2EFE8E|nr:alpha/beta hydrolase [Parahaliea mediterranea]